ncbi:hypothetical protein BPNPMPFG_007079 (plasmid) [Mesorhizobium sp. AR07]|uniref:2-keto-4-pentenoate hydratase n=1 Tax=Mesorhizobium sp. AR07 TaxID=2865838 RepID=UPI00216007ED|nr:fumarylacetoacetate hydrolase family protein [Mesorhizobium sp. AR07]UVK48654.1 hypothetical protein BPNPMPFG_007079 [Mesorhizobium sp. AR07]
MNERLSDAANRLIVKKRDSSADPVNLCGLNSTKEAYDIQACTLSLLCANVVGWKASLSADSSVLSAPIFDCDLFFSGETLPIQRMKDGVECELAFVIDTALGPLPVSGYTRPDVIPCIGGVMAAFELLDSRLVELFQSPMPHLLADNLGNGGVVLGMANPSWQEHDLLEIAVELTVDNVTVLSRRAGHPAGDPIDVVVALANHLAHRGKILEPGQFIMTGSYTGVHKVEAGQNLAATFAGFGSSVLHVAPAQNDY